MVKKHILDLENFKHILTAFGDKLTEEDMDDIFGEFEYDDDGNIFTKVTMTKPQRE
jgi:Ca2+-binding EF-hand superfamily protein